MRNQHQLILPVAHNHVRVLFTVTSLSNVARREEHRDIPMLIERSDGRGTTQVERQEWATRVRRRE